MKNIFTLAIVLCATVASAQDKISLPTAKFSIGDNAQWKDPGFEDAAWPLVTTTTVWEDQGHAGYDGYAWYRFHFIIPSSLKNRSYWKDSLRLLIGKVDDVDETFLNGIKIGQTGNLPTDAGGYQSKYDADREYHVSTKGGAILWDKENVLAIRVYDGGGGGGISTGPPSITMMDIIDGINLTASPNGNTGEITITNGLQRAVQGLMSIEVRDGETTSNISSVAENLQVAGLQSITKTVNIPQGKRLELVASFQEKNTGKLKTIVKVTPYLLTPPPTATPKINGAKVAGVRPNSPFLYKIAATGQKPLHYAATGLPASLLLDENTGVISGSLSTPGDYTVQIVVTNSLGSSQRGFTIKVGNLLALTPPMGWNSWNCWGVSVSADKVKSSAQALIDKGLIDHGWGYVNIDDGWEKPQRAADGTVVTNEKFPDMKGLGDWLHGKGLKFGIYSSPGLLTCGGYLASYQHEMQDATSYASWGIDYLKYDWCSYGDVYTKEGDTSLAAYMKPYQVMQKALKAQPRDITYSLCQYGMHDVWKWGAQVDGNSWRTTGDITDTWQSLYSIGFSQTVQYPFAQPGHWNDPDMLIVGQVGWGALHPTRLTPDEQYTHISLWCLLSAPLLIGCDISKIDDFTLNLLTNDEVLAVDQDVLGKQAQQLVKNNNYQVWVKPLEDCGHAIGIFNLSEQYQTVPLNWQDIGLDNTQQVRDIWRQKDLGSFSSAFKTKVPPHGVVLLKVTK